jgi:predicted amidohydrolase
MDARIACITLREDFSAERSQSERVSEALDLIDLAAYDRCDLICLPEAFAQHHLPSERWSEIGEGLDGEIFTRVSKKAREHACYVVCPALIRDGDRLFNTAMLIDRAGACAGRYDKCVCTISEIQAGVTPGSKHDVFETDFGRVGIVICFDLNFPEIGRALRANGAKLICFPSMYEGGLQLCAWALELQCYVASAVLGGTSVLVDPLGRVMRASSRHEPIISGVCDLDFQICHIDYTRDKLRAMKAKYGSAIGVKVATPEARYMITVDRRDVTTETIMSEFDIETYDQYCARSLKLCAESGGR